MWDTKYSVREQLQLFCFLLEFMDDSYMCFLLNFLLWWNKAELTSLRCAFAWWYLQIASHHIIPQIMLGDFCELKKVNYNLGKCCNSPMISIQILLHVKMKLKLLCEPALIYIFTHFIEECVRYSFSCQQSHEAWSKIPSSSNIVLLHY